MTNSGAGGSYEGMMWICEVYDVIVMLAREGCLVDVEEQRERGKVSHQEGFGRMCIAKRLYLLPGGRSKAKRPQLLRGGEKESFYTTVEKREQRSRVSVDEGRDKKMV